MIRSLDRQKPLPSRAVQSRTYGVWVFMRGFPVNGDHKPAELSRPPERPPPELGIAETPNRRAPQWVRPRSSSGFSRRLLLVDFVAKVDCDGSGRYAFR